MTRPALVKGLGMLLPARRRPVKRSELLDRVRLPTVVAVHAMAWARRMYTPFVEW
jgi:hypothetical protein